MAVVIYHTMGISFSILFSHNYLRLTKLGIEPRAEKAIYHWATQPHIRSYRESHLKTDRLYQKRTLLKVNNAITSLNRGSGCSTAVVAQRWSTRPMTKMSRVWIQLGALLFLSISQYWGHSSSCSTTDFPQKCSWHACCASSTSSTTAQVSKLNSIKS